jgi:uncharacterized protein YcaQ
MARKESIEPGSDRVPALRVIDPLQQLRTLAVSNSLPQPTTLKAALDRMAFVQADPIRSPARAQDLILRHRVESYRAGDLEQHYPSLEIEEDVLYAYGFLSRPVWHLLQPRDTSRLLKLEKRILEVVNSMGQAHPKQLEEHFGRDRVINAWGSYSKETTQVLDDLRHRGLLRVARRENGIRIYEAAQLPEETAAPAERLQKLILLIAGILAPVPEQTLTAAIARFRNWGDPRRVLKELIQKGALERHSIGGLMYIWPPGNRAAEDLTRVRLLAPFDPIVWDRRRFEHLWGWAYRFEAYTPPKKRIRGYYAMPLLWRSAIIGWANARVENGKLAVELGFVNKGPSERAFRRELDRELDDLERFLGLGNSAEM